MRGWYYGVYLQRLPTVGDAKKHTMRNLITFTFIAPWHLEIHETHIVPANEVPKDWAVANLPRLFEIGCKLVSIEIN